MQCLHPLFGAAKEDKNEKNNSHQHGQDESNTELMDLKTLVQKYERLPDGAVIVFDGFAILQAVDSILSNKNYRGRDNIKHLAFLQYPFGVQADMTESVRELCKARESAYKVRPCCRCERVYYQDVHDAYVCRAKGSKTISDFLLGLVGRLEIEKNTLGNSLKMIVKFVR